MAEERTEPGASLSQVTYEETPYAPQSWEIVGEYEPSEIFEPEAFQVLQEISTFTDPMFADYGGLPPRTMQRWHVPQGQQASMDPGLKAAEEAAQQQLQQQTREAELAEMRRQAMEEGRLLALNEAVERQSAQLEQLRGQLTKVLQDMELQFRQLLDRTEKEALNLSIEISRKILGDTVELNPEYLLPILHDALRQCGTAIVQKVRVSPEDFEFISLVGVERHLKEFDGTWKFEADPGIKAGCVVDTSAGEVDFQLDKAWERMREKILTVAK